MVKIKEGYVMTPRQQAEYERVNALPRKAEGTVAYYYKPQTKYPPRIYVFMHAEIWQDRNRRPMGLHHAMPFLKRPMNREEIEYHHFDERLCYHQYEDWEKLIFAEQQEADLLNAEQPGTGTMFLQQLLSFRNQCPIGAATTSPKPKDDAKADDTTLFLQQLIRNGENYTPAQIGEMLVQEQQGPKRAVILLALREWYKVKAGETVQPLNLKVETLYRKAEIAANRTRRNFVRRVYSANPMFALAEIRGRYPDYDEAQLALDLKRKPSKPKRKKRKPVVDLRRCQLRKLAAMLKLKTEDDREYHQLCEKIAILSEADRQKMPIPIPVTYRKETLVYYFNWKTREEVVKSFVVTANQQGMTHERLQEIYRQVRSSNYSF